MKLLAVTQRVQVTPPHGERRDQIDQRWPLFLSTCGYLPLLIPNRPEVATRLLDTVPVAGILLTGGNDLGRHGGDASERDETELLLLQRALTSNLPLLGVCRGMQLIQEYYGVPLHEVDGHAVGAQENIICGRPEQVNSYHAWGASETRDPLEVWGVGPDGVVKAVRHRRRPIQGIMWHPERLQPFAGRDQQFFRVHFEGPSDALL